VCRRLEVGPGLASGQAKPVFPRSNRHAECRAGERLAIRAVADVRFVRVDLGLIANGAAMAGTIDLHLTKPLCHSLRTAVMVTHGTRPPEQHAKTSPAFR